MLEIICRRETNPNMLEIICWRETNPNMLKIIMLERNYYVRDNMLEKN